MTTWPSVGDKKDTMKAVAVDTSADLILAANARRKVALIYNLGAAVLFLGKSAAVLASDGFPVAVNAPLPFRDDFSTDAWYGITSSGTADVRVIEVEG